MINYAARLPTLIADLEVVRECPMTMIDVGCRGGIHPIFARFGESVVVHGFDPGIDECERLTQAESRPGVRYHAAFVRSRMPDDPPPEARFIDGLPDTSAGAALNAPVQADIRRNVAPSGRSSSVEVTLDGFMDREGLTYLDWLKVDVDGTDLDVLRSGEKAFCGGRIAVVATEVDFTGGAGPDENTFHNVDRLLRGHDMELANLEIWRYSLKELPSRFRFRGIGETTFGPPFQGDAIYFNPHAVESPADPRSRAASILKQAALLEVFCVPDCAAKLLLTNQKALAQCSVRLDTLLDALVPRELSYADHLNMFRTTPMAFFPAENEPIVVELQ
jgi:FkbM family methyltransferase